MRRAGQPRVAFLIAHCFRGDDPAAIHGSFRPSARTLRALVLDRAIFQIHSLFGRRHKALRASSLEDLPAENPFALDFDLFVFTTRGLHLLPLLVYREMATHVETSAPPGFLGFECARWIRENLGRYDYYVYLEDDIVLRDPLFFLKLDRFYGQFGALHPRVILQPQRYEEALVAANPKTPKSLDRLYIDYDDDARTWGPVPEGDRLTMAFLGLEVEFEPARNPHAGCYVLTEAHAQRVVAHPDFLNQEKVVITPIDTAATAFVARALTVYKPTLRWLSFLDVYHGHQTIMRMPA